MNRQDYNYLLAEQTQLRKMLEKIPVADVIDRMSIESRLQGVERLLSEFTEVQIREPARVKLTFRGQPVVGSYGIFADFGAAAVSKFIDAVASVAASFSGSTNLSTAARLVCIRRAISAFDIFCSSINCSI